jgi:FkbM family methyltransferase
MIGRGLARIAAALPYSAKTRFRRLKPIYARVMRVGGDTLEVTTAAGSFRWTVDRLTSQRHILGTYEPDMQRSLLKYVCAGAVVYDVGAHVGFHTLFAARLTGREGKVISFEPNSRNLCTLRAQVAANPELPITVIGEALGPARGHVRFDNSGDSSMGRIDERGQVVVPVTTVDYLVSAGHIPPPHVIKIDVEGYEELVLEGARSTISRYMPVILCDYNDHTTLGMIQRVLSPLGYWVEGGPPVIAMPPTVRDK